MLEELQLPQGIMIQNLKKRFKHRKRSGSLVGSVTGSISDVEDRVVMLCEDVPSEGSSWDSGRGSQSPGTLSSSESHSGDQELGQGWSSHSFQGGGRQAPSPSRPARQLSLREGRYQEAASPASPGDHYAVRSTLHVKQL